MNFHRTHNTLKLALTLSAAVGAMLVAGQSYAVGSANSNLGVSATVSDNCTISALPVAFGIYDTIGVNATAPLTASGSVTVLCTNGATASIALGQGNNAVGDVPVTPVRQMASGANRLGYFLYSNVGLTTVWGGTTSAVTAVADGAPHTLTVYGSIDAGHNLPKGTYTDTVVATVNF